MKEDEEIIRLRLTKENLEFIDRYAQTNFGGSNRNHVINYLIKEKRRSIEGQGRDDLTLAEQLAQLPIEQLKVRKQFRLNIREVDYHNLVKVAKENDTSIQYYANAVLIQHLYGERRLLGNELAVIRQSNYELSRIGVNLNQIARAIHERNYIPPLEIGYLKTQIDIHTDLVKSIIQKSIGR